MSPATFAATLDYRLGPQGRWVIVRRGAPRDVMNLTAADVVAPASGLFDIKRPAKRQRYLQKLGDPGYKGPRILAEGDSWFEHPLPTDTIEILGRTYAVLSLAKAGDSWSDYASQEGQYYSDRSPMGLFESLRKERPKIVLISGSGNEILGDIQNYVKPFAPNRPVEDYIITEKFERLLAFCGSMLLSNMRSVVGMGAHAVFHSYDYPNPQSNGQYIGAPLEIYCRIPGPTLWRAIVNRMLDLYFDYVSDLLRQANEPKAHFIRLLGTIGTNNVNQGPDPEFWWDEIHPSAKGSRKIAARFQSKIREIAQTP
ncbi:SGNH/GDSL hydrolase family protein [Pseudorhodoplanes sp.]|uniref:SGNH/GDSL hydrolase family protein n=1 Tax=Pseudorhodoplanes sp. TaxID=1934341 RepID=UPI003D0BCFE7